MISVNATLFVQVGLFLILLYVLNRMMVQPLFKLSAERDEHVKEKRRELVAVQDELGKVAEDYDKRLKKAEQDARSVQGEVRRVAKEEAFRIIEGAQEHVVAIRQKARRDMKEELDRAREQLSSLAEALSYDVTEKVVGRRI